MAHALKINKKLLPVKIHYFTYFAGIAALWPFIQVFGRQLGITEINIGIIFTIAPIFGIICNPLFGYVADKYRIKKKLFLTFIFLNIVVFVAFALLPYKDDGGGDSDSGHHHGVSSFCNESKSSPSSTHTSDNYERPFMIITTLSTENPVDNSPATEEEGGGARDEEKRMMEEKKSETFVLTYNSLYYWYFAILVIFAWVAMAVVTSVADALCFQTLGEHHHLYGMQRQFGSLGWGFATFFAGYLIDLTSNKNQPKNYAPCFYLVAILLIINLFVSYKWKVEEEVKSKSMRKDLLSLVIQPRIAVFILACVIVGICTGLQWNFLYWYIEDLANASRTGELECDHQKWLKLLQGAIAAVQCFAGEVPLFYLSGWVIKKLGHVNCFSIVLGAFSIRFLIYSTLTNPWMILPVELFQGLTYGIFYATMASYAFIVAPEGTGATVQSVVAAAFEGIGVGIGSLLAGSFFKVFTGRIAFRIFGILAGISCLLHIFAMYYINARSKGQDYQLPKENNAPEKVENVDEERQELQVKN